MALLLALHAAGVFGQTDPFSRIADYTAQQDRVPSSYHSLPEPTALGIVQASPLGSYEPAVTYPSTSTPDAPRWESMGFQSDSVASETSRLVQYEMVEPVVTGIEGAFQDDYGTMDGTEQYLNPYEYQSQILPQGLIYRAYLAGEKESRFRSVMNNERNLGWKWDVSLGGHVGIYRYGTTGNVRPQGFQVDIEGAGLLRLDPEEDRDVDSADFRFGVPLTWGTESYQVKFAYYHLSSHLQDEFLLKNVGYPRLNYSRDVIVLGQSYYLNPDLRLYGEAGYAMFCDVCREWEFQFGVDYSPAAATGWAGAPFAAVNAHLRQEVNYGGNMVFQLGWAWRRSPASGLFRIGAQYFNGKSEQFSFYNNFESKAGLGVWYDY